MIIYWSPDLRNSTFLNRREPEPIVKIFKKMYINEVSTKTDFLKCPSIIEFAKNTFSLKSPINYSFTWDGNNFFSEDYDQEFFNNFILSRDPSTGFFSLRFSNSVFFSEEDVEMSVTGPYLTDNEFSSGTIVMPGVVNISRWFRGTDIAFFIRENFKNKKIQIKEGDDLLYLNFKTDSQIKFKKFYMCQELEEMLRAVYHQKYFMTDKTVKTYFSRIYNYFTESKTRDFVIKKIKENLME